MSNQLTTALKFKEVTFIGFVYAPSVVTPIDTYVLGLSVVINWLDTGVVCVMFFLV